MAAPASGAATGKPPVAATNGVYAGFWKRFAAFIIDYLIAVVLAMVIGGILGFIYGAAAGTTSGAEVWGALAGLAVWWLYYALMESSQQQATLGKMALGIRVTDQSGARISFGRATGRLFAKLLSGMILMIGYLMAGFTARKQALHDMIAGCVVINKGATQADVQSGVTAPGMPWWAITLIVMGAMVVPLGIMAAIAIPAYQDFTLRAKVADAMSGAATARVSVMEYYEKNEKLPGGDLQTLLKETGATMASSPHVRSMTLDAETATIRVVIAQGSLDGKSLSFTPRIENKTLKWQCRSDDVPRRYLPHSCREETAGK
jgi:uncharacterized RDD family membrane protein YckC/Tfp pilus assembly protein PilE